MTNLTIVIPIYNEENRLPATLAKLNRWKAPNTVTIDEIIFVNDGSTDRSVHLLKNSPLKFKTRIISYRLNQGKGYAVRQGMLASSSPYTLLMDADLSTPLNQLQKFLPYFRCDYDVIIGTRKNGHSTIIVHQPRLRERLGQVFTSLSRLVLGLNVTDFTCGFKAFSRRSKDLIFRQARINRWAYDSEVIFLSHIYGFSRIEQPVIWADAAGTKVRLVKDGLFSFFELLKIRYLYLRNAYGVTSPLSKPVLKLSN